MSERDPLLILPTGELIKEKQQELTVLESCEISIDHVMDFTVDIWTMLNADMPIKAHDKIVYDFAFERIYDQIGDEYALIDEESKNKIIANCAAVTVEFYKRLKPAMDVAHSLTSDKIHYLGMHGWLGDDLVTTVMTLPESEICNESNRAG